jgi:hypothetical protein
VLLIDRKRGKPRHLTNVDAIKALLDAYDVPYTHLTDFRGTFEEQVRLRLRARRRVEQGRTDGPGRSGAYLQACD